MGTKLIAARVLCDNALHAIKADQLLEAEPATIKPLAADGVVDVHKDAVAYARASNAQVVRSAVELAVEAATAKADALRVEIAKLQDLVDKAADEATKAALTSELAAASAELTALG